MSRQMRSGPHFGQYFAETMSYNGALNLVAKIKHYWNTRGLYPKVWAEQTYINDGHKDRGRYQVRSDMVGGRPCRP